MDTRWLQDFLTLAETRNFTRAAARRNTSQAAFSRRIQSLEAWAGAALIDRGVFPPALTTAGEQFRNHAADLLARLADARGDIEGRPVFGRDHVRVALPYVIATSMFSRWWSQWTTASGATCALVHGNVLDLVGSLVSGSTDIMICHETAQQPVHLDPAQFERIVLGRDVLRPWAGKAAMARGWSFPGSETRPVPLLMYSPAIYFARLVDLIIEAAPQRLLGVRCAESDMADVLHAMTCAGLGVGWFTDATVGHHGTELLPLGGPGWTLPLSIVAFRARHTRRRSVADIWSHMLSHAALQDGVGHPERTRKGP
ncbi:MAG: LysR family transcriptional regulator [Hyphomicrobiales bacterium]|nr:LysR family transcriptional regulator [Hyphomicrobiales bacterium]